MIFAVLFVAESIPNFGPILNLIGGSTTVLTSAAMPLIYNVYLKAAVFDQTIGDYRKPTLFE